MASKSDKEKDDLHECIYPKHEDTLNRLNLILFGNGHPEDGLAFVVRSSVDHIKDIKDNMKDIKDNISKLSDMYAATMSAAITAQHAVEKYKVEMNGVEKGKSIIQEQKTLLLTKWIQILGVVFAFIMLIFGYKDLQKQTKQTQSDIQKMETVMQKQIPAFTIPHDTLK